MPSDNVPPSLMQEFRVFVFQEISQHLTPSDVEHLVYTQDLAMPDLTESSIKVLMKLEMRDRFSVTNLKPLADMLRKVNRNDLAKKVDRFQKSQRKKDHKKKVSSTGESHAMYQQCQVIANIQTTKLQAKILLEQTEELESIARKFGHIEIARDIKEAVEIIENQFQEKLMQASSKLPQLRQERTDSSESSSSSTCSTNESSLSGSLERRVPQQAIHNATSQLRDNLLRPLLPAPHAVTEQTNHQTEEANLEDHEYEYVTHRRITSPLVEMPDSCLYYSSTDLAPQSRQDNSKGIMVTGKDGPAGQSKRKPAVAPKPAKLQQNWTNSSPSTDYTGGSTDTSTEDSGFVDASKFRKDCPPRPLSRHKYESLKADQREVVSSYATPSTQDALYDEVYHEDEQLYVNTVSR